MKKGLTYLLMLSIFLDGFVIARTPVNLYFFYVIYIIVIALYFFAEYKLPINKRFILFLLVIGGISILKAALNQYPVTNTIKQLLAIIFSALPFFLILKLYNFDVKQPFKIYIYVSILVSFIGILQEAAYFLLHLDFGYGFKVTSVSSEPAHLAIALAPAFFVAVNKFFLKSNTDIISRSGSLIIIITWFLTMSGVAMLGLVTVVLVIIVNRFKIVSWKIRLINVLYFFATGFVLVAVTMIIYLHVPFIKERVDDTWATITAKNEKQVGIINLSTYTLYSNFLITKAALADNPILGTGLGTHGLNYDRYNDELESLGHKSFRLMELNKEDANSMLLRILSELGIVGLAFYFFFLYQKNIRSYPNESYDREAINLWLINNACLVTFIMRLMRFGNYSVLGFFLFLFLYLYSRKHYAEIKSLNS